MNIQDTYLELIKNTKFNNFDGNQIHNTLQGNKELWKSVIMDSDDLKKLDGLVNNKWNVDTLYILSSEKDDEKLEDLTTDWNVDDVEWIEDEDALILGCNGVILRLWWDS